MPDRLRRKLLLSLKIIGSKYANRADDEQDILRKGSSALSHVDGLSLPRFLRAQIEDMLQASRTRDESRAAKVETELEVTGPLSSSVCI